MNQIHSSLGLRETRFLRKSFSLLLMLALSGAVAASNCTTSQGLLSNCVRCEIIDNNPYCSECSEGYFWADGKRECDVVNDNHKVFLYWIFGVGSVLLVITAAALAVSAYRHREKRKHKKQTSSPAGNYTVHIEAVPALPTHLQDNEAGCPYRVTETARPIQTNASVSSQQDTVTETTPPKSPPTATG